MPDASELKSPNLAYLLQWYSAYLERFDVKYETYLEVGVEAQAKIVADIGGLDSDDRQTLLKADHYCIGPIHVYVKHQLKKDLVQVMHQGDVLVQTVL